MRTRLALVLSVLPVLAACGKTESPAPTPAPTPPVPQAPAVEPAPTAPAPAAAEKPVTEAPAAPATENPAADAEGFDPGNKILAFTVEGTRSGKAATVDSKSVGAVAVYCVTSTTCPTTAVYAPKLKALESTYAAKGVQFVWLYSNRSEAADDKTASHQQRGLGGLFSTDKDAKVAKLLDFSKTPELVVVAKDGRIVYRGAVDDGGGDPAAAKVEGLRDGIEAALAGRKAAVDRIDPAG